MSTITSTSGASTAQDANAYGSAGAARKKTLGQDEFLQLLAKQFQSQDPMKPMDDTSFIAQMAQFSSLQQSSAMMQDISAMKAQQQLATANSYLGHRVTVDAGDGETLTGDVTGVEITDGTPRLVIGENTFPVSAVRLVEPAPIATANTTAQNQ